MSSRRWCHRIDKSRYHHQVGDADVRANLRCSVALDSGGNLTRHKHLAACGNQFNNLKGEEKTCQSVSKLRLNIQSESQKSWLGAVEEEQSSNVQQISTEPAQTNVPRNSPSCDTTASAARPGAAQAVQTIRQRPPEPSC